MNGIDYLIGKIKRMICFVFGHNLKPHYKREWFLNDDVGPGLKIKYYKCTRCGKKITVNEYKKLNIKIIK